MSMSLMGSDCLVKHSTSHNRGGLSLRKYHTVFVAYIHVGVELKKTPKLSILVKCWTTTRTARTASVLFSIDSTSAVSELLTNPKYILPFR